MYFYIYLALLIVLAGFILGAVDLAIYEEKPADECFTPEEKERLTQLKRRIEAEQKYGAEYDSTC